MQVLHERAIAVSCKRWRRGAFAAYLLLHASVQIRLKFSFCSQYDDW